MRTHNIPSYYRKSKRSLLCLLTWRFYQPSLARTTPVSNYLYGPKGVPAIEVRLYLKISAIVVSTEFKHIGFQKVFQNIRRLKIQPIFRDRKFHLPHLIKLVEVSIEV